jgi:hypothetical protein
MFRETCKRRLNGPQISRCKRRRRACIRVLLPVRLRGLPASILTKISSGRASRPAERPVRASRGFASLSVRELQPCCLKWISRRALERLCSISDPSGTREEARNNAFDFAVDPERRAGDREDLQILDDAAHSQAKRLPRRFRFPDRAMDGVPTTTFTGGGTGKLSFEKVPRPGGQWSALASRLESGNSGPGPYQGATLTRSSQPGRLDLYRSGTFRAGEGQ